MIAVEADDTTPIAWRCEQDRKLHPASEPSFVVYIEEINTAWSYVGGARRHGYFTRRMIVCRTCRRTVADFDPETGTDAGGSKEGGKT